uniref:Transient receptor potential cation channel, subfamily V, member 6 n=1 Tax=Labrus bergylta TaxID=56723 RepID=A0A3Q3FIQ4_9LABR
MSPSLARSAPSELNHWWSQLRFRLQNKKGWNEMLDETFLLYTKYINDIPLFYAAKKNSVGCIKKLLSCASTNIFERGALGETALHVAAMNDNLDAAEALMDGAPELINEPMTSELFQGVTPLHIAVVNQNINLVHQLISRGGDVATPRVTGLYFRKRIGGLIYYGGFMYTHEWEHVLSFAACAGNEDIISMVIEAGASTRVQDYRGNTVLHILVLQPNKTIACQAIDLIMARDVELDQSVPLDMVPNFRGLTPFKLAAKEGNIVAFQHLVNKRRVVQWSLGPLTSNLYDLTEIDSWADDMSVLELIVGSHQREARGILEVTPVRQLVSLKWNLGVKHLNCTHIRSFSNCVSFSSSLLLENYTKSDMDKTIRVQKTLNESYLTYKDNLRLVGEIISVLGALVILLLEIPDILRVGARRYFGQTALGGPFHVILISYACLVVLLCVFRACGVQGEAVVMAVCLVLGWCNVMFFARGFEMLGPYVIMIQKIIFGDLTKFMWLSFIVLIGFSTSLWMVYMTQEPESIPSYRSFPVTLFSQFELSVGLIDLPVDHTIATPPIVHVLHCAFSVVSYILLLNLLIAMMSDTHWRVAQERDELWRTQVVATTLMLERRLPRCLWPRLGVCGLNYGLRERWYLRVEDRNDPMFQKMRRYIKAFSKEDEQNEKTDAMKGSMSGTPKLRPKNRGGYNKRRSLTGWQMIRHSALGFEMEMEEPEEDIKFV